MKDHLKYVAGLLGLLAIVSFAGCALNAHARPPMAGLQDNGKNDANGGPFVAYPLTPGRIIPSLTKADLCAKEYTDPVFTHETKAEVYKRYTIDQSKWGKYTTCCLIGAGIGGSGYTDNLIPLANDATYGPPQKKRLDAALRVDVCKGADLNATRVAEAKDWIVLFVQKFGKIK